MAIPSLRVSAPPLEGQTILVVDDEQEIRQLVSSFLDRDGFRVTEAVTGSQALEMLKAEDPNLVILDVALPEVDGFSILSELRKHSDIPVILLTGRAEESDRILGLELGADDYIVKPFSPRELVARVRNLLKRLHSVENGHSNRLEFEDLVIDRATREVRVEDEPIDLTPKEFDLLEYFCTSPRQVFSRDQLLAQVWDSSPDWQDPATVTVHVRRVRKKIEKDPAKPKWITTVWGVGYRFEP